MPFYRKIGYIGWLGHGNLGDEAMFSVFKDLFSAFKVLSFKDNLHTQRIESLYRKRMFDAVLLGGGTLINSGFIKDFKAAQKKYRLSFTFGAGVQNPDFWGACKNCLTDWIECLNRCMYVGVRGPLSRQILSMNGLQQAEIIGDPALSLAKDRLRPKPGANRIGVNIGVSNGDVWGDEENILNFAVKIVQILIDKGWDVTFIPVRESDMLYIREAINRISRGSIPIFEDFLNHISTINFLESLDLFIGEKLHSVVLAMCAYTPSIMLEYRPKCLDYMMAMELDRFNMRTDRLSVDLMLDLINQITLNMHDIQNAIFKKANYYKTIQKEKSASIARIILES